MKKLRATWEDVQEGFTIVDKTGRIWRVTEFESGADVNSSYVHMVSGEKKGRIPMPHALTVVDIVILNTKELLELELGAKEVS